jgi:hypothetical protein
MVRQLRIVRNLPEFSVVQIPEIPLCRRDGGRRSQLPAALGALCALPRYAARADPGRQWNILALSAPFIVAPFPETSGKALEEISAAQAEK